jgi:hypothetical protein
VPVAERPAVLAYAMTWKSLHLVIVSERAKSVMSREKKLSKT